MKVYKVGEESELCRFSVVERILMSLLSYVCYNCFKDCINEDDGVGEYKLFVY